MRPQRVKYMLRRPVAWWKLDECIKETIEYCKGNYVDEILWSPETTNIYKELLPLEGIKEKVSYLEKAGEATKNGGILYSINVATTLGHAEYGGDMAKIHPGLKLMVDYKGIRSKACPCPLSSVWQELIASTYRLYASTGPVRIWVDDDFRFFNHGPVRFACFCEEHIGEFAKRVGETNLSREKLVEALLRPGEPHPWRAEWLRFQEEALCNAAKILTDAVKEISPETQMGWMSSTPAFHEIEGRHMGEQIKAFAPENENAAIRMHGCPYNENCIRELMIGDENFRKAIPQMPKGTLICTEIECMPHSTFMKSANRIGAEIAWACALNIPNHTLNLYDFLGTPMNMTPNTAEMLRSRKEEFNNIAGIFSGTKKFRGIAFLSNPRSADFTHTNKGEDMRELMPRENGWIDALRAFGMPVVCGQDEDITALTGQALRGLSYENLMEVFSRGVLMDLSALEVLQEMGYAEEFAGVRSEGKIHQRERWIGPEHLIDPDFAGGDGHFTWTYMPSADSMIANLQICDDNARAISRILDADLKILFNGVVIYENKQGGRVAVFPYNYSGISPDPYEKGTSRFFYSEYRKLQIQSIVNWLSRNRNPLLVEANGWILPHRADGDDFVAAAAMNINMDAWEDITFKCHVDRPVSKVQSMGMNGKLSTLSASEWEQQNDAVNIKIRQHIEPLKMGVVVLNF